MNRAELDAQEAFFTQVQKLLRDAANKQDTAALSRAAGMIDGIEFLALPEGVQTDLLHQYSGALFKTTGAMS